MRLSLVLVRDVMEPVGTSQAPEAIRLSADMNVREAMSRLLLRTAECASVEDSSGTVVGRISVSSIFRRR